MSANEVHVGDIGTVFTATLKDDTAAVDISGVTTRYFLLKKPDGSNTTITASVSGSGTSGVMIFTSTSSHFDTTGTYRLQAYISNATSTWRTDIYTFFVYPNLE